MAAEATVEVFAGGAHHGVDRIDVARDLRIQLVRVGGDAVDDAVAVLADQIVERLEILLHASGLPGKGPDEIAAAIADDRIERGDLGRDRVVDAARAERDGRCGFAGERDETLADPGGFGIEARERRRSRRLDLGLGRRALHGERADHPLGRRVDEGLDRRVLGVDGCAQLRFAGVEALGPALGRGVERRGRVLRAILEEGGEAVARPVETVAERLAPLDQRLMPLGDRVQPPEKIVAADDHGVAQPRLGVVGAVDQRLGALAEIAGEDRARLDQALRGGFALRPDGADRLEAARFEPRDELVDVDADGRLRSAGSLREPPGDAVGLGANGLEDLVVGRVDAADDVVGLRREGAGDA